MENSQVKDIAVGALTGHWPAHLGLTTDADKIEWLARQVERICNEVDRFYGADNCDDCDLCAEHSA